MSAIARRRSGSSSRGRSRCVAPALGFASGAVTAAGADPREALGPAICSCIPLIGLTMAAVLNAGIERAQPDLRPRDRSHQQAEAAAADAAGCRLRDAWIFTLASPTPSRWCWPGWSRRAAGTSASGSCWSRRRSRFVYSVPPFRTKRLGIWANVTIAIPRGVLLKVAGWSCGEDDRGGVEPWFIGAIFGLFLLGASTTKDFADMEGDARGGCRTLPIIYGVRRAAWMISPSFVVPFLLISVGAFAGILTGNFVLLQALASCMTVYGALRLLPDAAPSRGSRRRREPRVLGAHVPNDVRRADRLRARVRLSERRRSARGSGRCQDMRC